MEWLGRRRYFVLLLALLLLFLVHPLLFEGIQGRVLYDVLVTLVFLAAFLVVFTERRLRWVALFLGVPTLVAGWHAYAFPSLPRAPLEIVLGLLAALFLCFTTTTILRSVYRQRTVTADGVFGALCGYLLIGVVFGHLYCLVETLHPGSFRGVDALDPHFRSEQVRRSVLTYFSFATLTTVGYGDITPGSPPARWLTVVEAISGQFYLAVLIADLIGKRLAQRTSAAPLDRAPPSGQD